MASWPNWVKFLGLKSNKAGFYFLHRAKARGESVFMMIDTGSMIIFAVTMVATLLVQMYLKNTYNRWGKIANTAGLTGAEVARVVLDSNGLEEVPVEKVRGVLTDHYDPFKRVVRLSAVNYEQASVAGAAVAAHEVGHAVQHAEAYGPLRFRSALVRPANIGAQFGPWLLIGGFVLNIANLAQVGILLFAAAVLFQLVTLPVEFDASRRALRQMNNLGLVTQRDANGSKSVLNAAALTYVAAAAASVATLLYYVMMFSGRRD